VHGGAALLSDGDAACERTRMSQALLLVLVLCTGCAMRCV